MATESLSIQLEHHEPRLEISTFVVNGATYMLFRVAEYIFYPGVRSNGALHKLMRRIGLEGSLKMSSSNLPEGVSPALFAEMKTALKGFQHAIEPTQLRVAPVFAVMLTEHVARAAGERTNASLDVRHALIEVLGFDVPEEMQLAFQSKQLGAEGSVDLLLEERLDAIVETRALSISEELANFEPFASNADDNQKLKSYTLLNVPRALTLQLQLFQKFQTQILQYLREGGAVSETTAAGDVANYLRFAGWRQTQAYRPSMTCLSVCLSMCASECEAFTSFLTDERHVTHGTIANYLNSFLNVIAYVVANAQQLAKMYPSDPSELGSFDDIDARLGKLVVGTKNLREQAEVQSKREGLLKPIKPDWLSWGDAKLARWNVLAAIDKVQRSMARNALLALYTDALIICLLTIMPPDRCSVIRCLSVPTGLEDTDCTLKKQDNGDYYIDLTSFKHKTSKWYGISMTPVSPLITPILTRFLTMTQSFEFVDFGEDEEQTRTRRRYLFTMPTDPNRCFESSNWCSRVKDAFRRHSPGNKAPCPTLLRSSFITALRDSRPDLAVLESAAIAQKHSMRTQRSDVYDLRTHIRDCEEASKWCHEYANAPLQIDDVVAEEHNAGAPAEKRQRTDKGSSDSDETVTD
jgi:hypothetical protein